MTDSEMTISINEELKLTESAKGLTFGTDAYLLAAFVRGGCKKTCADLGSGTGIIPLLCAQRKKFKKITAVELQESFFRIIEKNISQNSLIESIHAICSDVRDIKASDIGGEVDAVTANPPYMRADSGKRNEHDEKFIARHEVFGGIEDFCACAYRLLKHGGKFYTVWRPDRLCDLICALRENRLEPKLMTFVHATAENEPSMVLVCSTKGAAPGMKVTRPLILHSSRENAKQGILSHDAAEIYDTCSFDCFKQ